MSPPLLFCHGLESAPIGRKSQALIDLGYTLTAPDCRGLDLPARIETITAVLRGADPTPVVVGSSFGGIASLVAAIEVAREGIAIPGLVLCAPALQRSLHAGRIEALVPPCRTIVVHGTADEVIDIALSRAFAEQPGVTLVEVDDDHRLAARGLAAMVAAVAELAGPPPRS